MLVLRKTLAISLLCGAVAPAFAQTLGPAANYNAFALGSFSGTNSDVEGRLAAGGSISLQNYDVALKDAGGDVIVAGGAVSFTNGTSRGNIRHGGAFTSSGLGFTNGGSAIAGNPINFTTAGTYLKDNSSFWGGLANTGTVTRPFSTILLNGTSPTLNVFSFNASLFSGSSDINILVPSGSTVLVNILGTAVTLPNFGWNLNGSQDNNNFRKVLWNLPQAITVGLNSVRGSILAPRADITGGFGAVEGQLIVGSFSGPTQINHFPYSGSIDPVPEPASMIALGAGALALLRRRKNS